MTTDAGLPLQAIVDQIAQDAINAVAERPGESDAQQLSRQQSAHHIMGSFQPRDPLEAMLAGHCVMFDQVMHDAMHDAVGTQTATEGYRIRNQVLATGRMFMTNLKLFLALHARTENRSDAPMADDDGVADAFVALAAATVADLEQAGAEHSRRTPQSSETHTQPAAASSAKRNTTEVPVTGQSATAPGTDQAVPQQSTSQPAARVISAVGPNSSAAPAGGPAGQPGTIPPAGTPISTSTAHPPAWSKPKVVETSEAGPVQPPAPPGRTGDMELPRVLAA